MVLFTLDEFKQAEGIAGTRFDALVTALGVRVSRMVDRFCNRIIEGATYTEELDGSGTKELLLANPPNRAVTSVKLTTARDFASVSSLTATEYVFDDAGVLTILPTAVISTIAVFNTPIFPRGTRNIEVQSDGGFATVPEDITHAAIMWGSYLMIRRRQVGITASTLGGQTLAFQADQVPREVKSILWGYRLQPKLAMGWA